MPIAKTRMSVNALASVTIVAMTAVAMRMPPHATSESLHDGFGSRSRERTALCPRNRDCGIAINAMNRMMTGIAARKPLR